MKTAILILTLASSLSGFDIFSSTNAKRIQGKNVGSLSLCADGDALTWVSANARFECVAGGGGGGGTASTQAQAETGTNNTAMITPLAATYSVASAGACGLVRTSATVITIFPGATTAHPCVIQTGNVSRRFTAPATVTLSASSVSVNASVAYFYVKANGTIYVGLSSAFTAANVAQSGASEETPITDFPAGAVKLGTWLAGTTDDNWDSTGGDGNGGSNYISLRTKSSLLAGAGVTVTENSDGEETIATDTTTIPTKEDVATGALTYAPSAITGTTTLTMTTASPASPNANGVCVWGRMGASNSSGTVTLSVNSATARNVYKWNGSSDASQVGSELRANTPYQFCYDTALGSEVWLVNPGGAGGSASPLTTKGDLYTYSTTDARLPASGNNGKVLMEDSAATTGNKWVYPSREFSVPIGSCDSDGGGSRMGGGWGVIKGSTPITLSSCTAYTTGMPTIPYGAFADSSDTYFAYQWMLPQDFQALVSITYHYASANTTGNIAWGYEAMCMAASDPFAGASQTPSFNADSVYTSAASTTASGFASVVHATTNVDSCTAGKFLTLKVGAARTDGGDTTTGDVYFLGMSVKYTAKAE